jgi:AAA15 family ATPase/GTPase
MLKKLTLENITTFEKAEFNFSNGVNIIAGENSSGKSHVLKMAYSVACIWEQCGKEGWKENLIKKIHNVFKIEELQQLKNTKTLLTAKKYNITLDFFVNHKKETSQTLGFNLVSTSRNKITIEGSIPYASIKNTPLFFPAKEILSLYPNFVALYEKYALSFDETYYDLCKAIENPLLKNPNQQLLDKIENIIEGKIVLKNNNFYLRTAQDDINIFMVAEGWRKLGMLSYLIANDSLKENSILFWDEPEANLNPRLLKKLAAVLIELSQKNNIQIIIATHSLFLMKYFDYLLKQNNQVPAAFFNLISTEQGTCVEQGENLTQLTSIVALEEELEFYDKEQAAFFANF